MDCTEMSNQFDIQYNNITSNQAPGLTEYEKSIFLTKAQDEYVLSLYNGRNATGESFESSEELRRCLSALVNEATLTAMTDNDLPTGMSSSSKFFELPTNPKVWFITYEALTISNEGSCNDGTTMEVIPVTQDEYHRVRKNPFRGYNSRRALRLDFRDNIVEIICKYDIDSYYIRYIKEPEPIILEELTNDLTIKGQSVATECKLDASLHQAIVDRAVALAVQARDI